MSCFRDCTKNSHNKTYIINLHDQHVSVCFDCYRQYSTNKILWSKLKEKVNQDVDKIVEQKLEAKIFELKSKLNIY